MEKGMSRPENERYRPGCFFWIFAPFLLFLFFGVPWLIPDWNPKSIVALGFVECMGACFFFGLLNPDRFWWAWRVLAGLIFMTFSAYLVLELIKSGGAITFRGDTSVVHAALGLCGLGLPALCYALFGKFNFRD
jgi:hypothetical protein